RLPYTPLFRSGSFRSIVEPEGVVAVQPTRAGEPETERAATTTGNSRRGRHGERGRGAGRERHRAAAARSKHGRGNLRDGRERQRRGLRHAAHIGDSKDVGEGSRGRNGPEVDRQAVDIAA